MTEAHQFTTAIQLRQLQYAWPKTEGLTLDIEQLDIQAGERVFIKGASGSGKSTLLSLLGGVLVPQHGDIQLLGHSLTKMNGHQRDNFRANHIGFIFQMFNLLPYLGVIDNVTLPLHFSSVRKQRVLQRGTIQQEALRLLSHLDLLDTRLLNKPVNTLSVGQQQRVAAARALIGSPEIVIADEPTSSLDSDRRNAFVRLLINECRNSQSTLVFVSHDQSLQAHFDRTVILPEINRAHMLASAEG